MDLLVVDNDAKFGATLDAALDGMAVTVLDDWTQFRPTCDGLADNQMPVVVCGSEGDVRNCVEWNPRLTVIFWATEKPGDSQLLQLMRWAHEISGSPANLPVIGCRGCNG